MLYRRAGVVAVYREKGCCRCLGEKGAGIAVDLGMRIKDWGSALGVPGGVGCSKNQRDQTTGKKGLRGRFCRQGLVDEHMSGTGCMCGSGASWGARYKDEASVRLGFAVYARASSVCVPSRLACMQDTSVASWLPQGLG